MWTKNIISDEQIIDAAGSFPTMKKAAESLSLDFKAFMRRAKKLGVYKPNQGGKGVAAEENEVPVKMEDILTGNHKMKTSNLKARLFSLGLKENKCEECGIDSWNNKPITLELEHKDGNHFNNELSNLQILCPNCHSQTSTFKGRNKNKRQTSVSDEELLLSLKEHKTVHRALREIGYAPHSGNYTRAYELMLKNNLLT